MKKKTVLARTAMLLLAALFAHGTTMAQNSVSTYVGTLCYPGKTVTSETNSNLYDIDEGFKAAVDAQTQERIETIDTPADAEDTTVTYDSEATTVIYTKVELETPMTETPMTLEATTDGDITFSVTYSYLHPTVLTPVEYQINGGEWTTYPAWPADAAAVTSSTGNWPVTFGDAIHVSAGDKVAFRGNNAAYYGNGTGFECHITSTADVYAYGNVMSLTDADDFATAETLTDSWNFAYLFRVGQDNEWKPITNTTIKSHPEKDLVLPATTITSACYFGMFAGCQGITRAPELPATTLESQCYAEMFRATGLTAAPELPATEMRPEYFNSPDDFSEGTMDCYMSMFQDCTSLTEAPALPATTLAHGVYQFMFAGCTSLEVAPQLPATTLGSGCYMGMFTDCTSLITAPALPATTLEEDCYHRMFEGCTSLTAAPDLPAATLFGQVYGGMFDRCTSLSYVKCLATDLGENNDIYPSVAEWLNKVSSTGTFVKAAGMNDWPIGTIDGIPEGWTVVNMTETVTLNSDGEGNYWTTYYNDVAGYTADENATVYTAKVSDDQKEVFLAEVADKAIPAGNAVVLKSTTETITMTNVDDALGTLADNDLQGSATAITTPANTYMLVKGNKGVGFYHWTGESIPAGRGYLTLDKASATRSFLSISPGYATDIESVERTIEESDIIYDLTGRRLTAAPRQGIYVKNGKKVVIK